MPKTLVVGLVVEGRNDFRSLCKVIERTLVAKSPSINVVFRKLQPGEDATSAGSCGGWYFVLQWCQRNQPKDRENFTFSSPLAGVPACDVLVVHLDADVLSEFAAASSVSLPVPPWPAKKRAGFTEKVLDEWLWPTTTSKKSSIRPKHVLAAAVWATETWLLSALDPSISDPEEMDPVPALITIMPKLENLKKPGKLKKKGVGNEYEGMAESLVTSLKSVRSKCRQLEKFCANIESRA
jgi:hypothetical protein